MAVTGVVAGTTAAMIGVAAAGIGATMYSSMSASGSAADATQEQANAASSSLALQKYEFDQQRADMQPWMASAGNNLNRMNAATAPGGSLDPTATYGMAEYLNSPEYKNMMLQMQQSTGATQAGSAAAGNYGSGNMANALQSNAANIASQGYSTGLNDWQNQRALNYNMLAGLSNPNVVMQVGNAGNTMAANAGAQQIGAAQGIAGTMMQGSQNQQNAYGNIGNQLMGAYGAYNQNQLWLDYQNGGGGGGYSGMWGADTNLSGSSPQPSLNIPSGGYTPNLGSWGD